MSGGGGGSGGEVGYDINALDALNAQIKAPDTTIYDSPEKIDAYYSDQMKANAQSLQGTVDVQAQQKAVTDAVQKSNASGRIADPDYDFLVKDGVDYSKIDTNALASQRAQDYLNDVMIDARSNSIKFSQAEQDRIKEMRQAYEEKRLSEAASMSSEERSGAAQQRLARLWSGHTAYTAGKSLLSVDEPGFGTLLTS